MRVEPFTVGSYVHTIKRGARGMNIVHDDSDKWRFLRTLLFMNDEYANKNWRDVVKGESLFHRSEAWPPRKPIVDLLAYTLMPNHVHLLLYETQEGGVSLFMKKIGQSMTEHANSKYGETGSIFQGAYRSRTIDSDEYVRYVSAYIMVKNTFELYPKKGLMGAQKDFQGAWQWAITYPFSSLGDYAGVRAHSQLITKGILGDIFSAKEFKSFSRDVILGGKWTQGGFE